MASIELFGCWWGHKNIHDNFIPEQRFESTNAIGVKVAIYNCSGKEIKYITFSFVPFNSVNDTCDDVKNAQLTGPIKVNEGASVFFDHVWFNATLAKVVLLQVKIEYMDGSTETVKGAELVNIYAPAEKIGANHPNSSIHIGSDSDYRTFFDDRYRAHSYVSGSYVFNQESTFYKNYKEYWEKSIENYKLQTKKDQTKNKIKLIIIAAVIGAVALLSILPYLFN